MERSRKILRLCKIASASREVVAIVNNYADREDYNCVSRCHFQLEEDMRRISVACECLADILDKPSPQEGHAVDVRIQDWVVTEEPQVCLDTLSRMKSLLQQKENTSSSMSRMVRGGRGSTTTGMQDKIKEAVDLFNACKGCFHLLFSTELWCVSSSSGLSKHKQYYLGITRVLFKGNIIHLNLETILSKGNLSFSSRGLRSSPDWTILSCHWIREFKADTQSNLTSSSKACRPTFIPLCKKQLTTRIDTRLHDGATNSRATSRGRKKRRYLEKY
ncbi:hypothetical protein L210DRAFT_3131267 [Boletus edulis BED1]|uniref:Uncharacterized protein n=1 Tax=Boletus edulis BED1 TaxID=1328754 RepID=A0AAD4BGU9_BOLED|nr:hypothetical protein L210DRAFT_3131267 [Boletus edulis BED1]